MRKCHCLPVHVWDVNALTHRNKQNPSHKGTEIVQQISNLSIHNDTVSTKIYDKRGFHSPRHPSDGVYISQLIRFARASSHVTDFNNRNKFLTAKLLKQGYRYHKLCKAIFKFYIRHFTLIEKYHVSLKRTYATRYF